MTEENPFTEHYEDRDSQAQSTYDEHLKGNCEGYPGCDYCYAEVHGIEFL